MKYAILRSLGDSLLLALATNERINQYLLDHISDSAWNAKPPTHSGRTIAAIVSHMHNVRLMWLKVVAKGMELPPKLERTSVTKQEAKNALAASHRSLDDALRKSLEKRKLPNFSAGPAGFVAYLIAHDSHHRGQIAMQLRQLGARLPDDVMIAMWDWPKRAREAVQH